MIFRAVLLATIVTTMAAPPSAWGAGPSDKMIVRRALQCDRKSSDALGEKMLLRLLQIEREAGIPERLRGLVLATACHESGLNPKAEGDHKFNRHGKPMAIGLYQMWPWWKKAYGIRRDDPVATTRAFLSHLTEQATKASRICKHPKGSEQLWVTAWARALRPPPTECVLKKLRQKGVVSKHKRPSSGAIMKLGYKHLSSRQMRECQRCYDTLPAHKRLTKWKRSIAAISG